MEIVVLQRPSLQIGVNGKLLKISPNCIRTITTTVY